MYWIASYGIHYPISWRCNWEQGSQCSFCHGTYILVQETCINEISPNQDQRSKCYKGLRSRMKGWSVSGKTTEQLQWTSNTLVYTACISWLVSYLLSVLRYFGQTVGQGAYYTNHRDRVVVPSPCNSDWFGDEPVTQARTIRIWSLNREEVPIFVALLSF